MAEIGPAEVDERKQLLDAHEAHYGGRDITAWKDPRKVIAPNTERDDMAYALAGVWQAATILRILDMRPSELSKLSLMDLGCGTGKVTRPLQMFVGAAEGWDVKPECIELARQETARCPFRGERWPPEFYDLLPDKPYDIVTCTDVIPGLGLIAVAQLCGIVGRLSQPGTRFVANVLNFREQTISLMLAEYGFRLARPKVTREPLNRQGFYLWVRECEANC